MRTTVDLDEDVLAAVKDIAKAEGRTMSDVVTELVRRGLTATSASLLAAPGDSLGRGPGQGGGFSDQPQAKFGAFPLEADWPVFPMRAGGSPVTSELIARIEDELDVEDATAFDHGTGRPLS